MGPVDEEGRLAATQGEDSHYHNQSAVLQVLNRTTNGQIAVGRLTCHVANGGSRNRVTRQVMKLLSHDAIYVVLSCLLPILIATISCLTFQLRAVLVAIRL